MAKVYKTFEEWKAAVDAIVQKRVGLSCDDLPDYGYYDAYMAGDTPSQTASDAIRAAKDY